MEWADRGGSAQERCCWWEVALCGAVPHPFPAVPDPQPQAADLAVPHLEFLIKASSPTPSSPLDATFSVGTSLAPGSLSHLFAQV